VHNGIIENHAELRAELEAQGQVFHTETDTETVVQLLDHLLASGLAPAQAARAAFARLEGAYALAVLFAGHPELIVAARHGPPLAVGFGDGEMFVGSDALALAPMTSRIAYLRDGDWTLVTRTGAAFFDASGATVQREIKRTAMSGAAIGRGEFRHYMEKELHEHPAVIGDSLRRMIDPGRRAVVLPDLPFDLATVPRITMAACGSAFYAGLVGRFWLETLARLPVDADVASEFRYRDPPMVAGGAGLLISQSGETADTLAALRTMKAGGQTILSILNVAESTMARESDVVLDTVAGPTAQLAVLACLSIAAARARGAIGAAEEAALTDALLKVPGHAAEILAEGDGPVQRVAAIVAEARDVLYLGRGACFPVAMEGALKLKEISYIHAEGYAAGEMKHGPIALIDKSVPIIGIAPSGPLFEKTASNLQEAHARGGQIILLSDAAGAAKLRHIAVDTLVLPDVHPFAAPILYSIPVQLLAYHVAVLRGTDVDQPRNLAKSVTVE
jgi:glucosamine--fructose-6-phosphate aminotransferase (isomerizing)